MVDGKEKNLVVCRPCKKIDSHQRTVLQVEGSLRISGGFLFGVSANQYSPDRERSKRPASNHGSAERGNPTPRGRLCAGMDGGPPKLEKIDATRANQSPSECGLKKPRYRRHSWGSTDGGTKAPAARVTLDGRRRCGSHAHARRRAPNLSAMSIAIASFRSETRSKRENEVGFLRPIKGRRHGRGTLTIPRIHSQYALLKFADQ